MEKVFNREKEPWIRPWNQEKFDNLYNRDERFFSIIVKGLISWLNRNIVLYNQSINHFIFNTGSSYLYMESNGYEYNLSETTGEDTMYMKLPRCIIEIVDLGFPMEELTSPYARGNYERQSGNQLQGYNAEIRRLPIELTINMKYYLSNFNETLILLQELVDKLIFQQYFSVIYLGQIINCSIEFPGNVNPEINKIDMSSPDPNQRNITLDVKICTNYPLINTRTEIATDKVISQFGHKVDLKIENYTADKVTKGEILVNDVDQYDEFVNQLNNSGNTSNNDSNNESDNQSEDQHNSNNNSSINIISNNDAEDINQMNQIIKDQETINTIINTYDTNGDGVIDENDIIHPQDTNGDGVIDENDINESNENIIRSIIEKYDKNNDGKIDKFELLNRFDFNKDGVIDADDLENILEKIKHEIYDSDLDLIESCHYRIDYKDLSTLIRLSNLVQNNMSIDYDNLTNRIYVTNLETGDVKDIDMNKYKITNI